MVNTASAEVRHGDQRRVTLGFQGMANPTEDASEFMERIGNPLKTYLDLPPASTSHVDTH